jgi:membrane-bound ClpP family serine protease
MPEEKNTPLFPPEKPSESETKKNAQEDELGVEASRVLLGLLPGMIMVLLGCLFLLSHYGYLEGLWWQYFLVGLGVVLLVESRLQYKSAILRRTRITSLITGLIMIASGLLFLFDPNSWWPLVIIVIGLLLCLEFLWRRNRLQKKATSQKEK